MAPATEPASTAPPSHAATIASHTGVSLRTDRTCIGDSPTRYTKAASRTASAFGGVERVGPAQDVEPTDPCPQRPEPGAGRLDEPLRVLVRGAGRHDHHLVGVRRGEEVTIEGAAVAELTSTDEGQRSGHRGDATDRDDRTAPPTWTSLVTRR